MNRYIKLFGIELCMILVLIFDSFVLDILRQGIYDIVFWLAIFILAVTLLGFEKDKHLNKVDTMQTIFIVSIVYLIATYVFGFFFGYVRTIYNLSFSSILSNTIPILLIIILQELLRYDLVSKTKKAKWDFIAIGIMIAIFVAYDFIVLVGGFANIEYVGIFETIGLYILPSVAKNLLLTYMAYHSGYKSAILYRLIFEITNYLLPIFPDFGVYMQSVLNIAFPTVLFLILNRSFKKTNDVFVRENKKAKLVLLGVTFAVLALGVMLVSGKFKYYALTIGSGSMEPNLNIGDVVIVKKVADDEISSLKEGQILVYDYNKTIVHRIYEVYENGGEYSFKTKGDNNKTIDAYIVYQDQVIGIAKYKIPLIGKPTVWLSELVKD